jgi:hypothetical protein
LIHSLALIQYLALLVWNADAFSSSSSSSTAVFPDPRLQGLLYKRDIGSALFVTAAMDFYAALWTRTWTVPRFMPIPLIRRGRV